MTDGLPLADITLVDDADAEPTTEADHEMEDVTDAAVEVLSLPVLDGGADMLLVTEGTGVPVAEEPSVDVLEIERVLDRLLDKDNDDVMLRDDVRLLLGDGEGVADGVPNAYSFQSPEGKYSRLSVLRAAEPWMEPPVKKVHDTMPVA